MQRVLKLVVGLLILVGRFNGQQDRGTIFGTVTDAQGAAVVGAAVRVINEGTQAVFATTTNESGFYTAPALVVGDYRVVVEMSGFKKAERAGIRLQVNQRAQVDMRLEVGSLTESVEVVAAAPLVDTGQAVLGKVIENRRIVDLPVNGRNAMALMMLTPQVRSNAGPTNSGFADRGSQISNVSINGGPNAMNNFTLDGAVNNNPFFGDINVSTSVDSVEEFKVQSGVMSAEFGLTAGGVVNIVTKAGTNRFRGGVYEFVRNDAFDARNTFSPSKTALRYNQYGGSLGGPVRRDRVFFFANYEEYRLRQVQTPITTVPTALEHRGDFSQTRRANGSQVPVYDPATTRQNPAGSGFIRDAFPGNVIPASRFDPVSVNVLPFYPLPNRAPSNEFTNQNNYQGLAPKPKDQWQYVIKGDAHLWPSTALSLRYAFYRQQQTQTGTLPGPVVGWRVDDYRNHNAAINLTHSFTAAALSETRAGASRMYFPFVQNTFSTGSLSGKQAVPGGWPAKLGLPASVPPFSLPTFQVAGFATIEAGASSSGFRTPWTWSFFQAVTLLRGRHSLKIGGEIQYRQSNNTQWFDPSGRFTFPTSLTGNPQSPSGTGSGLATFLLGAVSEAIVTSHVGESQAGTAYSLFLQDDWRISRQLTLNLGLRYDYQQWPRERNGGAANFNPSARSPESGLPGRLEFARLDFDSTPLRPDYNDFGPRLGFAYDVFGNSRTVLRGGYAVYYPNTFVRDNFASAQGYGSTQTQYLPPGGNTNFPAFQLSAGFPSPVLAPRGRGLGPDGLLGQNVLWDQDNAVTPLSQQWTLSIQRQLPANWVVEAAYAGHRGTHFPAAQHDPNGRLGGYDFNQLGNQFLSLGLGLQELVPNPNAGKVPGALGNARITRLQSLRPFPHYAIVSVRNPHLGNYNYHAFNLTVEKRFSQGLALLACYTSAKGINDGINSPTYSVGSPEQTSVNTWQDGKFNRRAERSVDPTDVAQRFVASALYELPWGPGKRWGTQNRVLDRLTGGWQLNAITTVQTGIPLVVRGANNFLADRPNSTGRSARLQERSAGRWFDTQQFLNPAPYTYGNVGRVLPDARTPGTVNLDLSLLKNTRLGERLNLQFRAEAFNALNHVNLRAPNTTFVAGPDGRNSSGSFGVITAARDARIMQLGLKLAF